MADIKSPTVNNPIYVGANGNQSFASAEFEAASVPANDVIRLLKLPIGTTINAVRAHFDSLGSGVSLRFAIRAQDGTQTNLTTAFSASSAGNNVQHVRPTYIGDEGPSELVVVVTGGTATGTIIGQIEFVATGY